MPMINIQNDKQEVLMSRVFSFRQWVYWFLGHSFYKKPQFEELININKSNIFQIFCEVGEGHMEGAQLLQQYIIDIPKLSKEEWQNIEQEYQRLFIGPNPLPAHPWESVYLSREHIILDEHTLKVREFYRTWGVEVENNDPDDHIGLELDFMAFLSGKGLECCQNGNISNLRNILNAQCTFLAEHPLQWVEKYCGLLAESTTCSLYKGIALFTPEYLKHDRDLLEELLACL